MPSNYIKNQLKAASKEKDRFYEFNGVKYKLAPENKIPVDDPTLPSYECESLRENRPILEFILDIYEGAKRWVNPECIKNQDKANNYIPQWSREPDSEYEKRVKRTPFHNFFAPAVKGFPGFLSDIKNKDSLFQDILDNWDDVDLQGTNFVSFMWQADLKVIRDGFCGILVDYTKTPRDENGNKLIKTLADQKLFNSRAYLVLLDRRNILSGTQTFINGKREYEKITIKEYVIQELGEYGQGVITRYKTFYNDGRYTVNVLIVGKEDEVEALLVEEGVTDLKRQPIVLYSATDINPFQTESDGSSDADPPLLNLAEKNRAYYELYSEYRETIHKMNSPVPVRIGLLMSGMANYGDLPDMVFGPNSGIDVPQGGDFKFVEPNGNVLASDKEELTSLEVQMNNDSLKFLSGSNTEKTATEVALEASQTRATLAGMATLKESAIEQVADLWANYYGKKSQGGTITINRDLLQMPLTSQEMLALSTLATEQQISVITLLEILREGKRLPKEITPAKEVQRLQAQHKVRLKQQIETMDTMQKLQPQESNNSQIKKESKNGFNPNSKNQKRQ
jgi:hypothetical protein